MRTRRLVFGLFLSYFCAAATFAQNTDSKPKQPVATIGGEAIYDDDLSDTIQGQLLPLRNQESEIKKRAWHKLIEQTLLEATPN